VPRPRWERYAAGTEAEHFAWWCRETLVQSVDRFAGKPLVLERWQRELMGEALAVDEQGRRVWQSVALVVSRKNGKTALLAAYSLYRLLHDEGQPEILLAAASDRQAGRLFDAVVAYVRRNPRLAERLHVRDYVGEIARADGGGKILRMASDPATLHGYTPSLVVCDELHAWSKPSQRKAWAALTTAGAARQAPQVFTISTAGDAQEREAGILGRLVDGNERHGELEQHPGLTISRNRKARMLVYNYSAPTTDPYDVEAMALANPARWVTRTYLRRQAENPELTDAEVLQLHGCVWAVGETAFLPGGEWRGCADPGREVPVGARIVLAFDGSDRRDSTALVACTAEEEPHVFVVGHWQNPNHRDREWRVPRAEVERTVADAIGHYRVLEFACDPPGWHAEIERWADEYPDVLTMMFPTNRRQLMADACARFENAVRTGALTHDGSDVLAEHLANAVVKTFPLPGSASGVGRYITKDHPDSPRKIDLAVAAIVAYARQLDAGSVYDERGMVFV
jgi:phage terminase large subunit-like protein